MRMRYAAFVMPILLILVYWFTRTQDLLRFPIFIDETVHILWARDVYDYRFFTGAANGKLFGLWWMAAMGLEGDGVFFVVRAATILFQTITVATLFSLGHYFAGKWGATLAVLFYILAPYAFFYDRLALVDPYVVTFGVLATWFAVRATHSMQRGDAVVSGVMLFGAILAKASGIMLWIVPLLAYLLLGRLGWRKRVSLAASTYCALLVTGLPALLFLQWRGYSYFSTATTVVGSGFDVSLVERVLNNLVSPDGVVSFDAIYFSPGFLLLAVITTPFLSIRRWRQALFLIAALALPLGGLLAFADKLSPRYFHFHVPFALLLVATAVTVVARALHDHFRIPVAVLPLLVLGIWGAGFTIPFHQQFFRDPAALDLPRLDRLEYVESDASGFGTREVMAHILESSTSERRLVVVGMLPQCDTLALFIPSGSGLTVECPLIRLDTPSQSAIEARIVDLAETLPEDVDLWLAYEATPYTRLDGIAQPLVLLRVFPRPGGQTQIELLRVEREARRD